MTDTLLQVNNLPQDIKTHMYGFIHIEDRVKIMMEQYYDMLISNNSIWYHLVNHLDEELLEVFNNHSYDLYDKLGFPNVPLFILNNSFPKLNETIHFSRNKLQKTRHPFYDDIASFIRRGFKICVDKDRFNSRRYKSYKDYLIDNRVNIKKNFENQYNLFTWKTYNNAFDRKYLELMFNHLQTVLISIHRPSISRKIKNAIEEVEKSERESAEKRKECNEQNLELMRMQHEERLSKIYEKKMNLQTKRLLKEQRVALLEQEAIERREQRKAKRVAIELQRQEEKEAKRVAILKKKEEKESSRKLREKLARQREQDRMLVSCTKMMQAMFTIKVDRVVQKALKDKLKREKEYDRIDKEVLKAMQNMFKITRKKNTKQTNK
jgi:hypothetical protein